MSFLCIQCRRVNLQTIYYDRRAILYVTMGNTDITIEEDYTLQVSREKSFSAEKVHKKKRPLQDFVAVVATLGGSVGIFLGWSLLDLVKLVTENGHKLKDAFFRKK